MSNLKQNQKLIYIRYKIVYDSQIGGQPDAQTIEQFNTVVTMCDLHKDQNNFDHSLCPLCMFTNAGAPELANKCTPIAGNGNRCFQNPNGEFNRMDIQKYIEGKSKITVENNIYIVEPDGEICFGNTITSCLTYCFILDDNTKISAHINPFTNVYNNHFVPNQDVINNEVVTVFNALNKLKNLVPNGKKIKKIYLLGAMDYKVYNYRGLNYIGDNTSDVVGREVNISIKDHLISSLEEYLTPDRQIYLLDGFEIKGNGIYFINSAGNPVVYNSDGSLKPNPFVLL